MMTTMTTGHHVYLQVEKYKTSQHYTHNNYLTDCYEETIQNIRKNFIGKKYLFLYTKQPIVKCSMLQMLLLVALIKKKKHCVN